MLQSDELDAKKLQLDVTGFLEKSAQSFCEELGTLLVECAVNQLVLGEPLRVVEGGQERVRTSGPSRG